MTKLKIFLLMLLITGSVFPQEVEDYVNKIDLKLKKDKKYLNIHYMDFFADTTINPVLRNIPRVGNKKPFAFKSHENYQYKIVYLSEGIEIKEPVILYVDEIKLNSVANERFFAGTDNVQDDTNRVLTFKDIYDIRSKKTEHYTALYKIVDDFIIEADGNDLPSMLGINPDNEIKTSLGVSSRDNEDFLTYSHLNSAHWFPSKKVVGSGRRGNVSGTSDLRIDLSFSRLSFSHKVMDFAIGSTSLEVNVDEKVINLLPWQSMSVTAGFRTIIRLGEETDLNKLTYLEAKLMGRIKANTKKAFETMPYIMSDAPLLNFGNGVVGEFNITRPFMLPFVNVYFSVGEKNFENPFVLFENNGERYAYYSFSQFETSMSFYWNSSDSKTSKFRMDLGIGYYDVWKSNYNNSGLATTEDKVQQKAFPIIALHYNFVPNNSPVFGSKVRFFDDQFKLNFWLKIMEFSRKHSLRFEAIYITAPIFRTIREWELEGGSLFQLRYRLGL